MVWRNIISGYLHMGSYYLCTVFNPQGFLSVFLPLPIKPGLCKFVETVFLKNTKAMVSYNIFSLNCLQ